MVNGEAGMDQEDEAWQVQKRYHEFLQKDTATGVSSGHG